MVVESNSLMGPVATAAGRPINTLSTGKPPARHGREESEGIRDGPRAIQTSPGITGCDVPSNTCVHGPAAWVWHRTAHNYNAAQHDRAWFTRHVGEPGKETLKGGLERSAAPGPTK
jgi:hypothetical protein